MVGSWSIEETKALIVVWGQESIQKQLESIHKNRDIYQRICMDRGNSVEQRLKTSHRDTGRYFIVHKPFHVYHSS